MLSPGPAKKVTIHVNRDTSAGEDYLSQEIISLLFGAGIAGATVFYPAAGFGSKSPSNSYGRRRRGYRPTHARSHRIHRDCGKSSRTFPNALRVID